jgi:hypothetical protein
MGEFEIRVVPRPWNKGKLVGQKSPLKLKEIWAIRVRLQVFRRTRELALFDLGIDSKLRACDLLKPRVRDISDGERIAARAIVVQQKTSRPVQFEITESTRAALTDWIRLSAFSRRGLVEERQANGWFYRRTRGGRTRPTEATSRPSRLVTRQRPAPVGQSPNAASRAASSASAALRGRSTSVVALSPSRNCRRKFGAELLMIWWMDTKCCDLVNEPPSSIIILLRVVERRETYAQQRRQ